MKKLILRFLRNKLIEIGEGLIFVIVALSYLLLLFIGMESTKLYIIHVNFISELTTIEKVLFFVSIITFIATIVVLIVWIYCSFIDWIRKNWELAKKETGYNEN